MGFDWPTCSCLTLYLSCKPLEVSSEVSEYHWQQPHFTYLPLVFFPIEIKPQNDSALWWSSFFCHGMPSVVGKKDYWFWIRWDLHSDEFCILGALSRLAARSASTSLARLSISQTGMALMFTTMAPLCNLVNKVHVDFAKERQIPILHYSPGSALLPKIGQSPFQRKVFNVPPFFWAISVGRLLNRRAGTRFWRRSEASKKAKLLWDQQLTAERIPSGSCQFSRETSRRVRRKANLFSQPWRARQGSLQISPDQTAQTAAHCSSIAWCFRSCFMAGLWRISSSFQQRRQGSRHGGHLQFFGILLGVGGARKASQRQDLIRDYVMKSSEQLGMEIGGVQLIGWRECVPQMGIWVNDEHFFKGKRRKTNWLAWRKMLVSRSADFDMAKWWKMSQELDHLIRVLRSRWSRYQELIHQHDDSIFTIHCHIFPLPGGTQKLGNSALQRFRYGMLRYYVHVAVLWNAISLEGPWNWGDLSDFQIKIVEICRNELKMGRFRCQLIPGSPEPD